MGANYLIFSGRKVRRLRKAKTDLDNFFAMVDRPRGIHLCGNPDWDFLLNLDMDILSMDIYSNADIFSSCAGSIKNFLDRGGVLVWGIIPTGFEAFSKGSLGFLSMKLEGIWRHLSKKGLDIEYIISRSMLSPATCCLVNPDQGQTVAKAFDMLNHLSRTLREKYGIT